MPTGDWTYPNFDRDTSIGTGTTDLLLGGYHLGNISVDNNLTWFVEGFIPAGVQYARRVSTRQ